MTREATQQPGLTLSVVIPAYNNERWIGRAIDSVLSQSQPADEILVVDDGSTDRTAEMAADCGGPVRLIRQPNGGASAARNAGIEAASGNWIAFLDADDQWLPDKLRLQVEHLRAHPDLWWTTGNYIECLCESEYQAPALTEGACRNRLGGKGFVDDYLVGYAQGLTGHTDTMLIRRDLLKQAGGFRVQQKRFNDLDLWLRIAYRQPRIGYLAAPLAVHHLEAGEHISIRHHSAEICADLIRRHLKLAAEQDRLEAFGLLAGFLLRRWMRGMLFDPARSAEIRGMLEEFGDLLPRSVRRQYRLLTAFPRSTAAGCRAVSKAVRLLGLRRRAVRKPGMINR